MTYGLRIAALAATVGLLAGRAPAQTALGTAFTYQGRLTDGSQPANGAYDLELRLFTAASGGTLVGAAVVRDDVVVTGGLFTVGLDFGPGAFAGAVRWLELAVRPGSSTGAYTTLAPRQELTPAPNALFSATAPWAGLVGVPAGFADGVDDDSGGDITGVSAGAGLTGGATSGTATLAVDTAVVQMRVAGQCPPDQSIRVVNGDGTVACEPDDVGWTLAGNAGTNPATQFLGTTDAQPLVFRSNGTVAMRLSRGPVLPNVIAGSSQNTVGADVDAATIAGGGGGTAPGGNRVTDHFGAVGGGYGNVAGNEAGTASDAQFASVGGGISNRASGGWSTVSGGNQNAALGATSSVGGGALNQALSEDAAIAGGEGNLVTGTAGAVPGGFENEAGGANSFAGGFRARVRGALAAGDADGDEGTFVWADTSPPFGPFLSTGPNQFLVRASGGVGINTNAPAAPLDVDGMIRSRTGGFRFPDGTTQTTAATGGSGDITAVHTPAGGGLAGGVASGDANVTLFPCGDGLILKRTGLAWGCALDADSGGTVTSVTAGPGLSGGVISTAGTLAVAFAGNGAATTAARSDHDHDGAYAPDTHDHMGETWSTSAPVGLRLQSSAASSHTLRLDNSGLSGTGLVSIATGAGGSTTGLYGEARSADGRGVVGWSTTTSGPGTGVQGVSFSPAGGGVVGFNLAATGAASGVLGQTDSADGRGVYGNATSTSGSSKGVWGSTSSSQGFGVMGSATATAGSTVGVYGTATSSFGTGVLGYGSTGVWAVSDAAHGTALFANATATTGFGHGVIGQVASTAGQGVLGYAVATSGPTIGVFGDGVSTAGRGVVGRAFATAGSATGVEGQSRANQGAGVAGLALDTSVSSDSRGVTGEVLSSSFEAYGVAGFAPAGAYAGHFSGRVHVNGMLSKAGGSFKIDHPLDPANKYLYHSFVESPDMKNIYDGVVTTDANGFATVEMPDWFSALNRDFRYQLTVIGKGAWAQARVYEPLSEGRFVVQTDRPEVQVSWQVTGIRQDPYAERNRVPVEEDKPEKLRGKYLHPEEWGQPEEAGIEYDRLPSRRTVLDRQPPDPVRADLPLPSSR